MSGKSSADKPGAGKPDGVKPRQAVNNANAGAPKAAEAGARPMSFLEACAFQWVNPKAWAMALTAMTVYAPTKSLLEISIVTIAFGLVNIPCVGAWAMLGQEMRRFLQKPRTLQIFNWSMAILLIASLYPLLK